MLYVDVYKDNFHTKRNLIVFLMKLNYHKIAEVINQKLRDIIATY